MITLSLISSPTETALRAALESGCDILHLIVCGSQRKEAHYATLTLKSSEGSAREFTAQALGRLLTKYASLKLLIVQAFDANTKGFDLFGEVLAEVGVPAVMTTKCLSGSLQRTLLATLCDGLSAQQPIEDIVRAFGASLDSSDIETPVITLSCARLNTSGAHEPSTNQVYAQQSHTEKPPPIKPAAAPPMLFYSYSHKDESLRDQLEIHLASLQRLNHISSWHDRRILVGSPLEKTIDENLESAQVILLLISSDFIASDYCYEREMSRALEMHANREAYVLPVILRPCDWHELPFGKLLATPKDGKAITLWPDRDAAFLDVVQAIKAVIKKFN